MFNRNLMLVTDLEKQLINFLRKDRNTFTAYDLVHNVVYDREIMLNDLLKEDINFQGSLDDKFYRKQIEIGNQLQRILCEIDIIDRNDKSNYPEPKGIEK